MKPLKRTLLVLILTLLMFALVYAITAFVNLQTDVTLWEKHQRIGLVVWGGFFSIAAVLIKVIIKIKS